MRRVIAAVSDFADTGAVTTLADPEIVNSIRYRVQSAKVASGDVPRKLSEQQAAEIRAFGDTG